MAFFIKLGLSLGAGFWVARQLRTLIQKVVTRSIPMKERMAENFLQRLSNRSTIIGIVLALLIASTGYWGLNSVWKQGEALPNTKVVPAAPTPKPEPVPIPEGNPKESQPPAQEFALVPKILPERPQSTPAPQRFNKNAQWYIQIGAFSIQANAYALWQTEMKGKGNVQVFLAQSQEASAPWKILLGPFPTDQAARKFRDQQGISGFPRSGAGLSFP